MGGTESGSTDGARGKRRSLLLRREGQGRIFQSGTSCLATPPSFPLLSCLFTLVWYLFRPQKSTATVAQEPKESLSLLKTSFISLLPLSSLSLFLSDFQYLSSFLKCCFFKVSPNNSALELYFASLFMFTRTICVLWFMVLLGGRQKFLLFFIFPVIINRQGC